jgi:hypothetical protein
MASSPNQSGWEESRIPSSRLKKLRKDPNRLADDKVWLIEQTKEPRTGIRQRGFLDVP